ncbi:MAG: sensor histidine kinase, partial [Lachnospiraceae bacterium]|nr:sensor histidine kinase [Lachnospiraceae bacterium]
GGSICISSFSEGDSIIIRIEDTGKGFDANAVKEGEDRENHIGLENSKYRLKKLCDADLKVDSTVGKGTCVTITIPK